MKRREWAADVLLCGGGAALYAVSVNVFVEPNGLVPGGLTGVALVLNRLLGTPVGTTILLLNLPLFAAAWKFLGVRFTRRSGVCTLLTSLLIDLTAPLLPAYRGDRMLTALFGGLAAGAGLGLVYLRGATTGGTEIIARLLERRWPHIPIGQLLLLVDAAVIALGALVDRDAEAVMYAVVLVAVTTLLIDKVLYGMDAGKLLLIQTCRPDQVTGAILRHLARGVTRMEATGGYSGAGRPLLLCAVRPAEVHPLQQLVAKTDPEAFIIFLPADRILGKGFLPVSPRQP